MEIASVDSLWSSLENSNNEKDRKPRVLDWWRRGALRHAFYAENSRLMWLDLRL